jgi:hypothetical protein
LGRSKSFTYVYDFGDDWRHLITVEEILPIGATPPKTECFAAENACPLEDIGGLPGYMNYLEAILDPTYPEHRAMRDWGGGKSFDPRFVDIDAINRKLARFRF